MLTSRLTLAVCVGVLGATLLVNDAEALTDAECSRLTGNAFLAAVERGTCKIDEIVTAAGPQQDASTGGDETGEHDGRNGGRSGGKEGGSEGGSSTDGGGRAAGAKP